MRIHLLAVLCLAAPVLAKGGVAKIFIDKGSTYFRSDNKAVLVVGTELDAVSDPKKLDKPLGKALVLEVNGALARITLDEEAAKAKYVVVPDSEAAAVAPAAAPAPAPVAATAAPAAAVRQAGPPLNGKLEQSGLRFAWRNDSDASWTGCTLMHSDGSSYEIGEVVKHTEDGVLRVAVRGPPDPAFDHIDLICSEGSAKFWFDKPNAPEGKLKGYATNNSGGIILYNQNDTAWTSCDIRKPNGTHYVLGMLKGHADDSIAGNRFQKEESNKPRWIELRCREGDLHTAL